MLNFVTLFNSNYLSRGLVLYQSLKLHCQKFHLYIIAFGDSTYHYLKANPDNNFTVISLTEFEDEKLLAIKGSRTAGEYCWTSTPSSIYYCIKKFNLTNCTYVDADICFYSNPDVLINEMGDSSVLITNHHYTKLYDQSSTSGKYCVQFVTFKNTEQGITVLNWWREACIDWCFNRLEDGKFGDQKYLDNWLEMFNGVHELIHRGGGIAPWNAQQYTFKNNNHEISCHEIATGKKFAAVFFHFHSLKFHQDNIVQFSDSKYELSKEVKNIFYHKYVSDVIIQSDKIKKTAPEINCNGIVSKSEYMPLSFFTLKKLYLENIRSSRKNIFGKNLLNRINHHYYFNLEKFK